MSTAVVVVPRERFASLPVSLGSLFATVADDPHVVVVEGGTPADTRTAFEGTLGITLDRDETRYAWTAEHRARVAESTCPRLRRPLGKQPSRHWVVVRLERKVVAEQLRARGKLTTSVPRELPRQDVERVLEGCRAASDETVAA